ncbi:hypothetical protein K438DRAFT_1590179, partial [Mycena galopus ATCC 62051]
SLGLRVQLGHSGHAECSAPLPGHVDFTVVHINGLHVIDMDFCGCAANRAVAGEYSQQLLRMRWFPSTPFKP